MFKLPQFFLFMLRFRGNVPFGDNQTFSQQFFEHTVMLFYVILDAAQAEMRRRAVVAALQLLIPHCNVHQNMKFAFSVVWGKLCSANIVQNSVSHSLFARPLKL